MKYHKCYTFGYRTVASPANLVQAVDANGGLLVDIRHRPNYGNPLFSKENLLRLCSATNPTTGKPTRPCNYIHLSALGNRNYGVPGSDFCLANETLGLEAIDFFLQRHPLTLMCACMEFDQCHRSLVSQLLAKNLGITTQELRVETIELTPGKFWALSCHQPWATLIAHGVMTWEVRDWPVTFRGPLLIHSCSLAVTRKMMGGQSGLGECYERHERVLASLGYNCFESLPFGRIVGAVEVVDCIRLDPSPEQVNLFTNEQRRYSNFIEGGYAWKLASPRLFQRTTTERGAGGLWQADMPVETTIAVPRPPEAKAVPQRAAPAKVEETPSLF